MRNCQSCSDLPMGIGGIRWNRLPQGWKWSSILFHERVAEIVQGIPCLQYANNVLIGAESVEELRSIAHQVFTRFDKYGIKVNL